MTETHSREDRCCRTGNSSDVFGLADNLSGQPTEVGVDRGVLGFYLGCRRVVLG